MNRLLLTAAFAFTSLFVRAESAEEIVTEESVKRVVAEALKLVEAETGAKIDPAPSAKIAGAKEVAAALVEELIPQIPLLQPSLPEDGRRAAAEQMANLFGASLFGKFAPGTNTIYVVRDNFHLLGDTAGQPDLLSLATFHTIVIHEMVHASDHARFKAFDRISTLKTAEELHAWNAILEGHAQYVTSRILAREEGGAAHFEQFERIVGAVPPGVTGGERMVLELLNSLSRFAYHDGLAFFNALEKSGRKNFVEEVFRDPPKRKDVILHPERYGKPDEGPATKDLAPLFDALKKDRAEEWNAQLVTLSEVEFKTAVGNLLPAERLAEALKGFHGGQTLVLTPKDNPGRAMILIGICEMEDEAAAGTLFDLNADLGKAKDEKFKTGGIRITESKYGELKVEGAAKTIDARKTLDVNGQTVKLRDSIAAVDRWTIEVAFSNEPVKKKEVEALVQRAADFLRGK
ncbi:MAG: mitochondrial inner membrane protease ATP23 [Planctomycetes bacterium]|nr:mitochondrial inner membrane protease ATP23 [Planctomycetota bacterium]